MGFADANAASSAVILRGLMSEQAARSTEERVARSKMDFVFIPELQYVMTTLLILYIGQIIAIFFAFTGSAIM
ncbi:hypothetical protein ABDK75_12875 [Gluconobacter sp. OJA]|uniref:hypothetical protein n=1 Tax=Gluconobacter sp. OJA TaxID=3145197 RepID=UPI0031F830C4